ncbi:MAG: phenylalanine--tRNA ligase subunit beta [Candidatus Berkelbacteria bacterium]
MKILKSWLKEYIDFDLTDQELADALSLSGTAVDDFQSTLDDKVIIAEIREVSPHPNADRLRIAKVWTGEEELQIVCGAPNIEAGQIVPLALVGANLGEDFVIKKAEIRGVESFGMLCAADELGLGADHAGIMILDASWTVGKTLNSYIESDTVFDVEITPNRGDELSHLGVARELRALLKKELKAEKVLPELKAGNEGLSIKIENPELCMQYHGIKIKNIKIGESPEWLKKRVEACGSRSINNIVDITNYIMLDMGQPMHAFDAKKVKEGIIVRKAHENEDLVTLDGSVRALNEDMLVIADEHDAIALAGVMGGANSEIEADTTEIILECAEFERRSIRKTAKTLNLSTDASYRYERGIDSGALVKAISKATSLILELAGGEVSSDLVSVASPRVVEIAELNYEKINALCGLKLKNEEIDKILLGLGFAIEKDHVVVPSWRHDVSIWQDLAEEVSRIYGLNNIPKASIPVTAAPAKSPYYFKEFIKDILVDEGFSEVYGYAFMSEQDLKVLGDSADDLIEVANPVQPEIKYLRKSLIPGILKAVAKNPTFDQVLIFEVGHAFTKKEENVYLTIATSGKQAKKEIEAAVMKIADTAKIDAKLFNVRELTAAEVERFKIKKLVTCVAEIDMDVLVEAMKKTDLNPEIKEYTKNIHYRPLSKYPSLTRDLAFLVNANISSSEVGDLIYSISDHINRVELFDEFASDKLGAGKKNIAYHLYLQDMNKTMVDADANDIIKKVVDAVEEKFEAKFRDK